MSQITTDLTQLTQNWKDIQTALSQITQRNTVAGVIAYKLGKTYTPTVDDLRLQLVNDDPNHRLTTEFEVHVNDLFYNQGRLAMAIRDAQKAIPVSPNTVAEIVAAAQTGNYSGIRGA